MEKSNLFSRADGSEIIEKIHAWSPQDFTKDTPGFFPIPEDDYVKKYQKDPLLWPVEFFVVAYRRSWNAVQKKNQTEILVRKSANGTSKWGLGTGVPATRWMLSSAKPPQGYKLSVPKHCFDARSFPEFPNECEDPWIYDKIEICEDAFNGPDVAAELRDPELEEFANTIRDKLTKKISGQMNMSEKNGESKSWESSRYSVVKNVLEKDNSVAAIQGTLRMSGLFANRTGDSDTVDNGLSCPRFISMKNIEAINPSNLVESMKIYTMFPQMPDPMPLPSSSPEDLKMEIESRKSRMAEIGRDLHEDKYGRKFTHISTANVSNTIIGVYFTLDVTDLPGLDDVPAVDLFDTKVIKRHWVSLEDLKVLGADGTAIGTDDTKPTFISGFIARQLVKEGIIDVTK